MVAHLISLVLRIFIDWRTISSHRYNEFKFVLSTVYQIAKVIFFCIFSSMGLHILAQPYDSNTTSTKIDMVMFFHMIGNLYLGNVRIIE